MRLRVVIFGAAWILANLVQTGLIPEQLLFIYCAETLAPPIVCNNFTLALFPAAACARALSNTDDRFGSVGAPKDSTTSMAASGRKAVIGEHCLM